MNLKEFIQRLIVYTSFPPLTYLYKIFYSVSIAITALFLKNLEGVVAIYLRRTGATGDIVYGLSDIDLLILIKDEAEDSKSNVIKETIMKTYDRLSKFIILLGNKEQELGIYSISEFYKLFTDYPFYTYRFNDGRYTWRLLHGRDIVTELPPIEKNKLYLSSLEELKVWWDFLRSELTGEYSPPRFKKKYLWYKAISEAAKIYLLINGDTAIHSRNTALCKIKRYLSREQCLMIEKIAKYPKHLNARDDLDVNDLTRLFMTLVAQIHSNIEHKPSFNTGDRTAVIPPPGSNALIMNQSITDLISKFDHEIRYELLPYLEHIALIPQVEFEVNSLMNSDIDSFYLVLVQKSYIPIEKLRKVQSLFGQNLNPQNVEPFLVTDESTAFSLQKNEPHHCIKSIKTSPLFFALLSGNMDSSSQNVAGDEPQVIHFPASFETIESTIRRRVTEIKTLAADKDIFKMKSFEFLKFFWGSARAILLAHYFKDCEISIPITSRQILDALIRHLPAEAIWLKALHMEYTKELLGEENQSYRYFHNAVVLLNQL